MTEGKQIEIEVAPLQKHKLFIATPAYAGGLIQKHQHSCLELQKLLIKCNIEHLFFGVGNESLIPRARNNAVNHFLSDKYGVYTDLLFIDADIEFNPMDVVALLYFDKDLIGGNYPLKTINWEQVKKAVNKNPDISIDDMEKCGASFTSHLFEGRTETFPFEPIECKELATGFMLISRKVFETLIPHVDSFPRAPNEGAIVDPVYDFFPVGVFDGRYESEDYSFCRLWREQGGKIFICPWLILNHYGTHAYRGDMNRVIELLGEVS